MFVNNEFAFDFIDDGLAVAKNNANQIYFLNRSAALVWFALEESDGTTLHLKKLISAYWPNTPEVHLEEYLNDILLQWQDLGWIEYDYKGASYARKLSESPFHPQPEWVAFNDEHAHNVELLWSKCISISSIVLKVEIWGNIAINASSKVTMLSRFLNGLPSIETSESFSTLAVFFLDTGVCLMHDDRIVVFPFLVAASPVFNLTAIQICYPKARNHTVLHAAAVSLSEGSIILPGEGGAGKSTLTAHLVAMGWSYCGDDIIGLGRTAENSKIEILPFPTSLCLKEGSLSVLGDYYPEIVNVEPLNYGGKTLRFIPVDRSRLTPDINNWRTPRAVVFPMYSADSISRIERLSQWDALSSLLKAGTGVGAGTDFSNFELLLDLIKSVPCFRLRYSSLDNLSETLQEFL